MKKHLLFTAILASSFVLHSQNKIITVTNSLPVDREFETVELTKKSLGLPSSSKLENYAVKEKKSGLSLESQSVDNDGDGIADFLLFQPKIDASSEKEYEIVPSDAADSKNINCY